MTVDVARGGGGGTSSTGKEIVSADQISEAAGVSAGSVADLTPLTPTQRAGMKLAQLVGAVIVIVIAVVLYDFLKSRPPQPEIYAVAGKSTPTVEAIVARNRQVVEDYRALNEVAVGRATDLFQIVVATALLPVFTAILGYIFGRGTERGTSGDG